MKCLIPLALALSAASAAPSSSLVGRQGPPCTNQPSADQVATAINNWNTDVDNVNAFLNGAPHDASTASTALTFASDEPNELNVLAAICGVTDEYTNAVNNLKAVFGQVLTNLHDIINGGDVTTAVNNINQVRCCNVLPDLDVLWLEAAEDEGLIGQVNTAVPRPNACASIVCS